MSQVEENVLQLNVARNHAERKCPTKIFSLGKHFLPTQMESKYSVICRIGCILQFMLLKISTFCMVDVIILLMLFLNIIQLLNSHIWPLITWLHVYIMHNIASNWSFSCILLLPTQDDDILSWLWQSPSEQPMDK